MGKAGEVALSGAEAAVARQLFEEITDKLAELAELVSRQLGIPEAGFARVSAQSLVCTVGDGLTTCTDGAGNCVKYDYNSEVCRPC